MSTSHRAISLYRSILRVHRDRLPYHMRILGNSYVRNEFKLHKDSSSRHLEPFFDEWEKYVEKVKGRTMAIGKDLSDSENNKLSSDQRSRLNEFKKAVK